MIKRHRVLGENRHVRLKECGVIHRTHLHNENTGSAECGCPHGGAEFRAEVSGDGSFNIRALERAQLTLSELEPGLGNHDKNVGIAPRDVLALPAVALHRWPQSAIKAVADLAAITSPFKFQLFGSSVMGNRVIFSTARFWVPQRPHN